MESKERKTVQRVLNECIEIHSEKRDQCLSEYRRQSRLLREARSRSRTWPEDCPPAIAQALRDHRTTVAARYPTVAADGHTTLASQSRAPPTVPSSLPDGNAAAIAKQPHWQRSSSRLHHGHRADEANRHPCKHRHALNPCTAVEGHVANTAVTELD